MYINACIFVVYDKVIDMIIIKKTSIKIMI